MHFLKASCSGCALQLGDDTLKKIDRRNKLFAKKGRTKKEEQELTKLSAQLSEIGILTSFSDPCYGAFVKAYARRQQASKRVLSFDELSHQEEIADEILDEIYEEADS